MGTPSSEAKPSSAVKYAYMFEKDKSPTVQLDALLRAIAKHIIHEIGDKHEKHLTPKKLAAFYKAVGGDYDSLFVEMPHPSISYVWQVTGCQHTLQPTDDDFAAPSIPALTYRGFSRWESLEILLGPEEHVPFLQFAVKNWELKHPESGEVFPAELPKDVFPPVPDAEVDLWHQSCAQKLRTEAAAKNETPTAKAEPAPENHSPKFAYVHVRKPDHPDQPAWRRHIDPAHMNRGYSYTHMPGRYPVPRAADRSPDRNRREPSPKTQTRRRSFSDIPSPTSQDPPIHAFPNSYEDRSHKRPAEQRRRHSHPRHHSSDESSDEEPVPPKTKRRQHPESPPPPSVRRFVPPTAPQPPPATSSPPPSFRPHRSEMRVDDHKKRNVPSPRGSLRNKLSETVSNMLPGGLTDRPRSGSRQSSYNEPLRPRRSRDHFQPSRLSHVYSSEHSDDSLGDESSEDEAQRRRRSREDRERDRDRDRDRYRDRGRPRDPDRDMDDERDMGSRRDRQYLQRPPIQRRTSSHADVDRRRDHPMWETHNRDRIKEDRKRWDRRSQEERGPSPVTGVNGRRYHPEPAYG